MTMDPAVEPFVPTMSSPKSPRVTRGGKIITKRTFGPEEGYSFRVEETFVGSRRQSANSPCADIRA